MTDEVLKEAVRFLLRARQQECRIEASKLAKTDGMLYGSTCRERVKELNGDAKYCEQLLCRL